VSIAAIDADRGAARTVAHKAEGLSEEEAARRLAEAGPRGRASTSRSYASIVRANVLTVFNLILAAFGTLTLIFGDARDALFLAIILANAGIGITQEVRAKRALDRLSLLVAPRATVRRGQRTRTVPVSQVVVGDLVLIAPGDQLIADGRVAIASDLRLDESVLSGESEPVAHKPGDGVRSGAFVVEGTGAYEVTAVGAASFAARVTGEARSFRHPRSPLERAVNRLLYALVLLVIGLGAVLGYSLYHRHVRMHIAVATSSAGVVSLIPEGLMVLVSLTYAAAAVRMSRRGVLSQQLNAIESLASVDTLCVDKTGTLTASALRVVEVLPALPTNEEAVRQVLGVLAATASARNLTLQAIADACPAESVRALREVPFSSRRRWSAVQMSDATYYLGAPGLISVDGLDAVAEERQAKGRRVVAVAQSSEPLATEPADLPPPGLQPLGIVVLAEELRPGVAETIAFLRREEVEVKVLSGDAPANRGRNRERRRHSGHRRQRGRGDSRGSGGAHGVRAPGDGGGTDLPGG
jgi:P-type E1-E2 ATPase